MKKKTPRQKTDPDEKIARLVRIIREAEEELQALTGGQLDAVVSEGNAPYLLRDAQAKLRLSEAAQRALAETQIGILNALPAHIALLDSNGVIMVVNEAWRCFASANVPQSTDSFVGQNYLDVCEGARGDCADEAQEVAAGIRKVLGGELKAFAIEYPCHSPTEQRWFRLMVTPLSDAPGTGAVVMHINITERRQAEAELRESEERFRLMIEGSEQMLFYTHDREHRFNYLSPSTRKVLGYEPGELVGQPFNLLVIADDPLNADVDALTDQALQDGKPGPQYPTVVRHKDGHRIVLEISESPILRDGEVIGIQGFARDITERENARAALAESQRQYRDLVETSHNVIWTVDLEGRFTFVNQAARTVFGREPEEMIGHRYHDFVPEDQQRANDELLAQMLRDGKDVIDYSNRIRRKDGTIAILNSNARIVRDSHGRVIGVSGMSQDNTEVVRAQQAIAQSEARFRGLFDQAAVGMCLASTEGNFLRTNARFCEIVGYSAEELLQRDCIQTTHPDDRELEAETISRILAGDLQTATWEKRYLRKDGHAVWCNLTLSLLPAAAGLSPQFVGVIEDITERRAAVERLRQSEELLRIAGQIARMGAWSVDFPEARITWSDEVCAIHDMPAGTVPTLDQALAFYAPESRPVIESAFSLCARDGTPFDVEVELLSAKGQRKWVRSIGQAGRDQAGAIRRVHGAFQDITQRKDAELAVQRSEERFRELAENIQEVFWITDPAKNQMLYISPAYEKIWGRTCASLYESPRQWLYAIHPDDRARVLEAAATKQARGDYNETYRIKRPDGTVRWIHDRAFPVRDDNGEVLRVVGTAEDITERQEHERLAQRSQRLESIGTLAGGIAHDLNNALAPIIISSELLRMQYPGESEVLEMIDSGSKRAAEMVRQLLAFAKGAAGERVSVRPGQLVKELERLIKGSFPKNIQLMVKCDAQLPTVLGDATQLHQVLLNLCVNARDAMPHGGTLTLEAHRLNVDAAYASAVPDAQPGAYVRLRVRDTGTGIPPEILDRIFDPFFTTKGPDKGTGLGLSTVMGIIKGHGGFLQVYSQRGQGSTFAAYLPVEGAGSDTEQAIKVAVEFHGQGETILLVDDEAAVRQMARMVLQRMNFTPLTATDGADGLIQAAQHRTELRAVITDLHMPHVDGLAFVHALRRMIPDIPVVVASGRMEDAVAAEFKTLGVTARLDKPFTEAQLAEALQNLLLPT